MGTSPHSDPANIVVMGAIGAPFGIAGFVHVYSHSLPLEPLLGQQAWYIRRAGKPWQSVPVQAVKPHGQNFIALFKGYESREVAANLTNLEIGVEREVLPPLNPGEYYWADLIGMTVINETGEVLGQIEGLLETGSNDVLMVQGEKKEHLIPYILEDYVLEIETKARIMRVSWDAEF